jgi:hypothetical protein
MNYDYILFVSDSIPYSAINYKPQRVYKTRGGVENKIGCMVCAEFEHAQEGRGAFVEYKKLQPYSDALWRECEKYIARREQRKNDNRLEFKELAQGKIRLL